MLKAYDARGVLMQQGYGLTETSPMVSFLAPEFALTKVGSSGRTPMFVEVKIVDSAGATVETPGAQGEILVRAPNVFKGYWGLPEATAKAIDADGWLHTGDAGFLDEDGFLTVSDRIKDMIISRRRKCLSRRGRKRTDAPSRDRRGRRRRRAGRQWGERVVAVAALKPGRR